MFIPIPRRMARPQVISDFLKRKGSSGISVANVIRNRGNMRDVVSQRKNESLPHAKSSNDPVVLEAIFRSVLHQRALRKLIPLMRQRRIPASKKMITNVTIVAGKKVSL